MPQDADFSVISRTTVQRQHCCWSTLPHHPQHHKDGSFTPFSVWMRELVRNALTKPFHTHTKRRGQGSIQANNRIVFGNSADKKIQHMPHTSQTVRQQLHDLPCLGKACRKDPGQLHAAHVADLDTAAVLRPYKAAQHVPTCSHAHPFKGMPAVLTQSIKHQTLPGPALCI